MMRTLFREDNASKQKNNEWYTPVKYVEAARAVMGGIDLDPASCEMANRTVQARRYYTKEENGLSRQWKAKSVWLNPPYGRVKPELTGSTHSFQKMFAHKLLSEYRSGNVEQAILLSLGNPNSVWFQPFFDYILCFHRDRIRFDRPDGTEGHFGFPLAFVYLGPNESRFAEIFSQFGRIVKAIDAPRQPIATSSLWEVENDEP